MKNNSSVASQESTEELSANLLSQRNVSSETLVRLLIDDAIKSFLLFSVKRVKMSDVRCVSDVRHKIRFELGLIGLRT